MNNAESMPTHKLGDETRLANKSDANEIAGFMLSLRHEADERKDKEPDNTDKKKGDPDWASKGPFKVHQDANFYTLNVGHRTNDDPAMRKLKLSALNKATVDADKDQSGAGSYKHAMRNRDTKPLAQTADQAMALADQYVRNQFSFAIKLLNEGKINEAYYQFGLGLHTLQDATSPAHNGFQPWGDHPSAGELYKHVKQELLYPGVNSNLQKITDYFIQWFENANRPALPSKNLFSGINHD
jgi:hypothetical protein